MIVDETMSFLSQRKLPKMALIHQKLFGDYLILMAPGKKELKIPVKTPYTGTKCR